MSWPGTPGFEVVAEAGDGEAAIRLAPASRPDLVVLDLSLPGAGGLDVTSRLRELLPSVRVLILSVHDHPEYVLGAVRAGAQGYLRKDTSPAELRDALRAVARGESYFSPPVARHLSAAVRGDTPADDAGARLARLTPREREVLAGIAAGRDQPGDRHPPRTLPTHGGELPGEPGPETGHQDGGGPDPLRGRGRAGQGVMGDVTRSTLPRLLPPSRFSMSSSAGLP